MKAEEVLSRTMKARLAWIREHVRCDRCRFWTVYKWQCDDQHGDEMVCGNSESSTMYSPMSAHESCNLWEPKE